LGIQWGIGGWFEGFLYVLERSLTDGFFLLLTDGLFLLTEGFVLLTDGKLRIDNA